MRAKGITDQWYASLSPEQKDEVVDHALGCIAKNTQLLELESDGGNNDEYYKLTVSVARSGAPNAEDIFVKHASMPRTQIPTTRSGNTSRGASQARNRVLKRSPLVRCC